MLEAYYFLYGGQAVPNPTNNGPRVLAPADGEAREKAQRLTERMTYR